jgi:hypothetical protein
MLQVSVKFLLYSLVITYVVYQIAKWLFNYIYRLRVVNKAKGHSSIPVWPFIGNAHQFKRKYGKENHLKNNGYPTIE